MQNKLRLISGIVIILVILFSFSSCFLLKNEELDTSTTNLLVALVDEDMDAIEATLHPNWTGIIGDIDDFYESLDDAGIKLEGDIKNLTPTSRSFSTNVGTNGSQTTTESTYTVEIGDVKYELQIYTLKDNSGFGITGFQIEEYKESSGFGTGGLFAENYMQ